MGGDESPVVTRGFGCGGLVLTLDDDEAAGGALEPEWDARTTLEPEWDAPTEAVVECDLATAVLEWD